MSEIVDGVQNVTSIMTEIVTASREQTTGIEKLSQAVIQMDLRMQQNFALLKEASSAAFSLSEEASNLARTLATFQLEAKPSLHVLTEPRQQELNKNLELILENNAAIICFSQKILLRCIPNLRRDLMMSGKRITDGKLSLYADYMIEVNEVLDYETFAWKVTYRVDNGKTVHRDFVPGDFVSRENARAAGHAAGKRYIDNLSE